MTHVAAATPNLTFDCDTHYPWTNHDVIKGGKWVISGGAVEVPTKPGLGVDLDRDALGELHDLYLQQSQIDRRDTEEIKRYIPDYVRMVPRW